MFILLGTKPGLIIIHLLEVALFSIPVMPKADGKDKCFIRNTEEFRKIIRSVIKATGKQIRYDWKSHDSAFRFWKHLYTKNQMKKIVTNIYQICYQSESKSNRELFTAVAIMLALHAFALTFLSIYS